MLNYKVQLWTPDGHTPTVDVEAFDELRAAASAVPHFHRLGKDVATATSVDVIYPDGQLVRIEPELVLDFLQEHAAEFRSA